MLPFHCPLSEEVIILYICQDTSSKGRAHPVHTLLLAYVKCALLLCVALIETVCRKLCVHPAQHDVPAGGRGSGSVQQDHSFGQDCQQEPQPERHRPHRLLQSTEQITRKGGETRKVHNRDKYTYQCPSNTFNHNGVSEILVDSIHKYLSLCLDSTCQCGFY